MRPVAVDVGSNASGEVTDLTVLAPETISGGSVDETIRIDDGHDIEVVVVQGLSDKRILATVAADELVSHVLNGLEKD